MPYLKKLYNTIKDHLIGIELGVFFILLSELFHFFKYSEFSIDFMGVELMALIFIVLIINLHDEEKSTSKFILKSLGLFLLFLVISFTILFDHIFGPDFTCPQCDGVFEWILN